MYTRTSSCFVIMEDPEYLFSERPKKGWSLGLEDCGKPLIKALRQAEFRFAAGTGLIGDRFYLQIQKRQAALHLGLE